MSKSRSFVGPIITLIIVGALGYGGWYFWKKNASKEPEYSTVRVIRGDVKQTITATGTLQTTNQITISSQVSGNVVDIGADFNDHVTKGQMLLKIDPTTYEQKLRQAEADLIATKASTLKTQEDAARIKGLYEATPVPLVSKSEYDTSIAQLAQANSSLISREANYKNAQTDLARCTIYSPIEGEVLNRTTDIGGTVNVNQSAVALFTIINDLTHLQINTDVSEADIGNVQEGQIVEFTVDAYLNRPPFRGSVTQVRNFARNNSGVVTFPVIIAVDNADRLLKPGMTATTNILITERANVLMVANTALRVRIPPELQEKMSKAPAPAAPLPVALPASQGDVTLPADPNAQANVGGRRNGRGGGGGGGGGAGRRGGRGTLGTGTNTGVGMNVSSQPRQLFKLVTDAAGKKLPSPVIAHLGISDGTFTQIIDGVAEGDTLVTYVTMPGAAAVITGPMQGGTNPFQQGGRGAGGFGGGLGGGGGGGGRGGGGGGGGRGGGF